MGKEVIKTAQERGHELVFIFDVENKEEFTVENLQKSDVVFEFTQPSAAFENITKCLDAGVPCISGTTGWLDNLETVKNRCKTENKAFFYASNFSIGVNILFEINKTLAKIMNNYPNYQAEVEETHHIHKLDAPSGTAIQIAEGIIENLDRKAGWKLNDATNDEINVVAHREAEVFGIHSVTYESDEDYLEIKHFAKNRKGLALGAVLAAEFIQNKTGFFTMKDLLKVG